jgi:hypothetical protein
MGEKLEVTTGSERLNLGKEAQMRLRMQGRDANNGREAGGKSGRRGKKGEGNVRKIKLGSEMKRRQDKNSDKTKTATAAPERHCNVIRRPPPLLFE